jgi:transcriptional regulator with XRE-family HTH domain
MTIGDNLKRIAEGKGISMYRIAKDAEISNSYISDIVSNKSLNPSIEILKKIAEVLRVPVEQLIS